MRSKMSKLSVKKLTLVASLIRIFRMQWCCSVFCFRVEIPFLGKFGPKNQNYQFKLKFGTYTNSNMQNSMVMFILSVFDWKYPFWANLVQKVKLICLSWNLVPRLIRIWWIQWWCSLFLFLIENMLFGQIWSRKLKSSVQGETWHLN